MNCSSKQGVVSCAPSPEDFSSLGGRHAHQCPVHWVKTPCGRRHTHRRTKSTSTCVSTAQSWVFEGVVPWVCESIGQLKTCFQAPSSETMIHHRTQCEQVCFYGAKVEELHGLRSPFSTFALDSEGGAPMLTESCASPTCGEQCVSSSWRLELVQQFVSLSFSCLHSPLRAPCPDSFGSVSGVQDCGFCPSNPCH